MPLFPVDGYWSQVFYQPDRIFEFTAGFYPPKNHAEPKIIFDSVPEAGGKKNIFISLPKMLSLKILRNTSCCLVVARPGWEMAEY